MTHCACSQYSDRQSHITSLRESTYSASQGTCQEDVRMHVITRCACKNVWDYTQCMQEWMSTGTMLEKNHVQMHLSVHRCN